MEPHVAALSALSAGIQKVSYTVFGNWKNGFEIDYLPRRAHHLDLSEPVAIRALIVARRRQLDEYRKYEHPQVLKTGRRTYKVGIDPHIHGIRSVEDT